jgi:hypothetical protein
MLWRYPRWRPKWPPEMVKFEKSHIAAKKYDKIINKVIGYMFLTIGNSFLAF